MTKALSVQHLSISYTSAWTGKKTPAINDISFSIELGEAVGFLGVNGAGKTSTIKAILGLITPINGTITLFDLPHENINARHFIGYLPEQPYWYENLTVEETIVFYGALFGVSNKESLQRSKILIERLGLNQKRKSKIKSLSKGLMQRVGLIQTLINKPKLLILDEPFSGLDPIARKVFREIFLEEKKKGSAILISSHILPDVEALCDRALIIHDKEIKADINLVDADKKHQNLEDTFTSIAGPQSI